MIFDTDNLIVKLCALGMEREGMGDAQGATQLFTEAWEKSENDHDKFIAAHYLARHQQDTKGKLNWDEKALEHALQIPGEEIKGIYPSLFLNIGKCYEDLGNTAKASENYHRGLEFCLHLKEDGYGNMIRAGLQNGLKRII